MPVNSRITMPLPSRVTTSCKREDPMTRSRCFRCRPQGQGLHARAGRQGRGKHSAACALVPCEPHACGSNRHRLPPLTTAIGRCPARSRGPEKAQIGVARDMNITSLPWCSQCVLPLLPRCHSCHPGDRPSRHKDPRWENTAHDRPRRDCRKPG